MNFLYILLQAAQVTTSLDNPALDWANKLTLVGGLVIAVVYFQKQNSNLQTKYEKALSDAKEESEAIRKNYEEKVDKLLEKHAQLTEKAMSNMTDNTNSNNKLVQVITDLQKTLIQAK